MCTCILHAFKNISRDPIDHSTTKSVLTGLNRIILNTSFKVI